MRKALTRHQLHHRSQSCHHVDEEEPSFCQSCAGRSGVCHHVEEVDDWLPSCNQLNAGSSGVCYHDENEVDHPVIAFLHLASWYCCCFSSSPPRRFRRSHSLIFMIKGDWESASRLPIHKSSLEKPLALSEAIVKSSGVILSAPLDL